jgi:hypothetical protein
MLVALPCRVTCAGSDRVYRTPHHHLRRPGDPRRRPEADRHTRPRRRGWRGRLPPERPDQPGAAGLRTPTARDQRGPGPGPMGGLAGATEAVAPASETRLLSLRTFPQPRASPGVRGLFVSGPWPVPGGTSWAPAPRPARVWGTSPETTFRALAGPSHREFVVTNLPVSIYTGRKRGYCRSRLVHEEPVEERGTP